MAARRKTAKKAPKSQKAKAAKKKRARPSAKERKDRLLQTRITPSLYEQVVERAAALRIPVSNLIRIILEDSPRLVTDVVDESMNIAQALGSEDGARRQRKRSEAPPVSPPAADETPVAWQSVAIGRRMHCGDCSKTLYPAEEAHMGLGADGRPLLFVCPECYQKRARP